MSSKIVSPQPDRYGDTYQSGIDVNIDSDDTILESGENINSIALGRKEAAHIILKILSKLDIPWMRDAKRLPGWRDGL
ncbi:MAG: hypothetical protein ACM3SR_01330 [Ignavibacteriales bacterium]